MVSRYNCRQAGHSKSEKTSMRMGASGEPPRHCSGFRSVICANPPGRAAAQSVHKARHIKRTINLIGPLRFIVWQQVIENLATQFNDKRLLTIAPPRIHHLTKAIRTARVIMPAAGYFPVPPLRISILLSLAVAAPAPIFWPVMSQIPSPLTSKIYLPA